MGSRLLHRALLSMALAHLHLAASQAWIPLVVEPCAAPAHSPCQYYHTNCSSSGCLFASAQNSNLCIYSPGKDQFLYLAPCNASDAQQRYRWGKGSGGFVAGGGGCWSETAITPGGPAGDAVGVFGCGADQGVFDLLQLPGNLTQIISNTSGMCLDAQQPPAAS